MITGLHHDEINNYLERISNHKPLANQYDWKNTFPAKSRD